MKNEETNSDDFAQKFQQGLYDYQAKTEAAASKYFKEETLSARSLAAFEAEAEAEGEPLSESESVAGRVFDLLFKYIDSEKEYPKLEGEDIYDSYIIDSPQGEFILITYDLGFDPCIVVPRSMGMQMASLL